MEQAISNLVDERTVRCAELIVKYQKFSTPFIWKKFREEKILVSNSTGVNYINYGIAYILYGTKHYAVSKKLYQAIDNCIANCLQPLTPSEKDKRRTHKKQYQKKDAVLPVQKLPEVKAKLTEKFEYGIRIENRIILFHTENAMLEFIQNIKFINPNEKTQAVTVECENYERK